ncbi:hypothetical protein M434DRAFT_396313, partial [Hypoxylon sp. CO27-5]
MKPQRNQGSRLSQLIRLRVNSPIARIGGLSTRVSRARILGPPHVSVLFPLLRSSSSPAHVIIDDIAAGRTLIKHNGNNTQDYTKTHRDSNQQTHHHHHITEPSSLHSGLFSCSTTGSGIRKREASSTPLPPSTLLAPNPLIPHSSNSVSSIGLSSISPAVPSYPISSTSNRCFLIIPHRPSPGRPMAFSTYSTASSDISTPRSTSPSSSIISARSSHSSVSSKRLSLSFQRRQSALNPMSSVDISAIEEQMKMAALDGL